MDTTKPWYLSRTVWASAVTIAAAAGGLFGIPLSQAETASLTEAILQAVTAFSGLAALLGRLAAKARIG